MEQTFTEWYLENHKDGNLCPPPMTEDLFEKFLIKYLLNGKFMTTLSMSDAQTRAQLLWEIIDTHSKDYQKEFRKYKRTL